MVEAEIGGGLTSQLRAPLNIVVVFEIGGGWPPQSTSDLSTNVGYIIEEVSLTQSQAELLIVVGSEILLIIRLII